MNLLKNTFAVAAVLCVASFANADQGPPASADGMSAQPARQQAPSRAHRRKQQEPEQQGFNVDELLDVILNWGKQTKRGDRNHDGVVNIDDLISLFI